MNPSRTSPQAEEAAPFAPQPHIARVDVQATTTDQRTEEDDSARLPRIPRATEDCPMPLNKEEICDWKRMFALKRRPPTRSEHDDYDECDRQWYNVGSESLEDWSEDERYMDALPSPKQRRHPAWCSSYQAKRDARKQPLSPPRTPPHLRIPRPHRDPTPELQSSAFKVLKRKANPRGAPHRPLTRSGWTPVISLHDRKGYIKYWNVPWQYVVVSYEQYLQDFDREEIDKLPPEPLDWSYENPLRPYKTPYQREICRRRKAQNIVYERAVVVDGYYKGSQ